VQVNL